MKVKVLSLLFSGVSLMLLLVGSIIYNLPGSPGSFNYSPAVLSDETGSSYTPTPTTTTCSAPSGGCGSSYYWDTGSCSCKPQAGNCVPPFEGCPSGKTFNTSTCECVSSGSCTQPSGGCGSGYYWNTATCTCQQNTTACVSPSAGCGSGNYWDTRECRCKSSNSGTSACVSPSAGCGTNYYWDSGSCSCRYSSTTSTCVSPSAGCGSGNYWDTRECRCRSSNSGTSACVSPSAGCGTNYYWDSGSCSCRNSSTTQSTCAVPTTGCGTNYYWETSSCSCIYSTGGNSVCVSPSAGCGTNKYWDPGSCSCKNYQYTTNTSCMPPALGCGDYHDWDSSYCYCKPKSTTAICTMPSLGCGSGWIWDQNNCSCKSQTDPFTYYSSLTTTNPAQNYDRFSYEPPERIVCIKSYMTDAEYQKLRYFVPADRNGFEEISRLGEKAKNCWLSTTTVRINSSVSATYTSPIDAEKCLIEELGNENYLAIHEGRRQPSYREHLIFEKCNGKMIADSVSYLTSKQELPKSVAQCLKATLGTELYTKIDKGGSDVPVELRKKVDRCFGTDPQPFEEASRYKVPEEIRSCLMDSVGKQAFDEVYTGRREPSKSERQNAENCFAKLNKSQEKFLPPPPEKIHFAETVNDTVNFSDIKQEKDDPTKTNAGGEIIFKGKGPANSIVYIYIFSEPIVVTTKTDENGDWIYELSQPLEGEKHIAYAAVKSTSGKVVKSSVFDFTVVAAEEELANRFIDEQKAAQPVRSNFIAYALIFLSSAVMITGLLYILYFQKRLRSQNGGDGKGETASGTVN